MCEYVCVFCSMAIWSTSKHQQQMVAVWRLFHLFLHTTGKALLVSNFLAFFHWHDNERLLKRRAACLTDCSHALAASFSHSFSRSSFLNLLRRQISRCLWTMEQLLLLLLMWSSDGWWLTVMWLSFVSTVLVVSDSREWRLPEKNKRIYWLLLRLLMLVSIRKRLGLNFELTIDFCWRLQYFCRWFCTLCWKGAQTAVCAETMLFLLLTFS